METVFPKFVELINEAKSKANEILISMLTPAREDALDRKVIEMNNMIYSTFYKEGFILCHNDNFCSRDNRIMDNLIIIKQSYRTRASEYWRATSNALCFQQNSVDHKAIIHVVIVTKEGDLAIATTLRSVTKSMLTTVVPLENLTLISLQTTLHRQSL